MRKIAFVDIAILALVFWSVWSLRFAGVENIGLWTILAAVGAGAVLLASLITDQERLWHFVRLRRNLTNVLHRSVEIAPRNRTLG